MARNYPRFLFSNPQDTKSKGPFVVHLLFPKCICKVHYEVSGDHVGSLTIEPLEFFDEHTDEESEELFSRMKEWLFSQILGRKIKI